jgi:hypothetical protein
MALPPKLAYSHFSGIMLSVPRLIHEGVLRGPALSYLDEASEAVWRALGAAMAHAAKRPLVSAEAS